MHELACMDPASYFIREGWEGYRKYRNWQAHVLAVIFSAGMLLGTSYFTNGNWDFLFGAKKQILISAGYFIGFYIICDMGITYFWRIPEMEFFRKACGRIPAREEEVMWFRLAKISMIIGWTPFILHFSQVRSRQMDFGSWMYFWELCRWTIIIHGS